MSMLNAAEIQRITWKENETMVNLNLKFNLNDDKWKNKAKLNAVSTQVLEVEGREVRI